MPDLTNERAHRTIQLCVRATYCAHSPFTSILPHSPPNPNLQFFLPLSPSFCFSPIYFHSLFLSPLLSSYPLLSPSSSSSLSASLLPLSLHHHFQLVPSLARVALARTDGERASKRLRACVTGSTFRRRTHRPAKHLSSWWICIHQQACYLGSAR